MPLKKIIQFSFLLAAIGLAAAGYAFSQDKNDAPSFPYDTLVINRSDGGKFTYDVEVATTMQQELYGLMFRKSMPANKGMIFIYDPPRQISMWMKNTYIPLDMLFVRADGVIAKITTNAQPLDLTPLSSGGAVKGVIELNAGQVEKNGFKTGDKIGFSGFGAGAGN